jgi:hypothetical protein
LPRSGAVAGGVCGALAAVPLLAAHFFRILLLPELQTDLKPFHEFFAQTTTDFQRLQRYEFLNSLHFFLWILFQIFNSFRINNLRRTFFQRLRRSCVAIKQPMTKFLASSNRFQQNGI